MLALQVCATTPGHVSLPGAHLRPCSEVAGYSLAGAFEMELALRKGLPQLLPLGTPNSPGFSLLKTWVSVLLSDLTMIFLRLSSSFCAIFTLCC